MAKDDGLFFILDDGSRQFQETSYIFNRLTERRAESVHVKIQSEHEFAVAHYTGTLQYDANEITEKNRDFVPPEMIETLRLSDDGTVRELFTNKLTKGGALTIQPLENPKEKDKHQEKKKTAKSKWGAALLQSDQVTNLRVGYLKPLSGLNLPWPLRDRAEISSGQFIGREKHLPRMCISLFSIQFLLFIGRLA